MRPARARRCAAGMRDGRLYREAGYATFDECCREHWDMSKSYAHRMIEASDVVRALPPGTPLPSNETQARELKEVPDKDRAKVMRRGRQEDRGPPDRCGHPGCRDPGCLARPVTKARIMDPQPPTGPEHLPADPRPPTDSGEPAGEWRGGKPAGKERERQKREGYLRKMRPALRTGRSMPCRSGSGTWCPAAPTSRRSC